MTSTEPFDQDDEAAKHGETLEDDATPGAPPPADSEGGES
jgi:hypothetical protein